MATAAKTPEKSKTPNPGAVNSVRALTPAEEETFTRIRARAAIKVPWIVNVLYQLKPVYAEGLGTYASDEHGRVYLSFEGWAEGWTVEQQAGAMIHELFHFIRNHTPRYRDYRFTQPMTPAGWNIAADMEINDDIVQMPGVELPEGCVLPGNEPYKFEDGLLAEEYADQMMKQGSRQDTGKDQTDKKSEQGDQQDGSDSGSGSGSGDPQDGSGDQQGDDQDGSGSGSGPSSDDPGQGSSGSRSGVGDVDQHDHGNGGGALGPCTSLPDEIKDAADEVTGRMSDTEREILERRLAEDITKHVEAKGIGSVPKGLREWATERLAPPSVDWRQELMSVFGTELSAVRGRKRQTYNEVNRRSWNSKWAMPGRRATVPNIVIGLDTSGSMFDGSLDKALSEATGVLRAKGVKPDQVRTMTIEAMSGEVTRVKGRKIDLVDSSGGGTDMRQGFKAVKELTPRPTNFILLTDGETPWPTEDDVVVGVRCVAGIITRSREDYERLIAATPHWLRTIYIPLEELS